MIHPVVFQFQPAKGINPQLGIRDLLSSTQDGCDHAGIATTVEYGNDKEGLFFWCVGDDVIAYNSDTAAGVN